MPKVPAVTKPASKKRLALFLDGTWNTVDDNTNVWRLKSLCSPKGADGSTQLAHYEIGVSGALGLYRCAECVTLGGFPNQQQSDSPWQPRGLRWARLLRCGRTTRPTRFAGLRGGRRMRRRRGGYWRSRRCSMEPRAQRRPRSAAWIVRRCGTG